MKSFFHPWWYCVCLHVSSAILTSSAENIYLINCKLLGLLHHFDILTWSLGIVLPKSHGLNTLICSNLKTTLPVLWIHTYFPLTQTERKRRKQSKLPESQSLPMVLIKLSSSSQSCSSSCSSSSSSSSSSLYSLIRTNTESCFSVTPSLKHTYTHTHVRVYAHTHKTTIVMFCWLIYHTVYFPDYFFLFPCSSATLKRVKVTLVTWVKVTSVTLKMGHIFKNI